MATKKKSKKKAKKALRLERVRILKAESPAEDRHIVTVEKEIIGGPLPTLPEDMPLELEREKPESQQSPWYEFWNW